MKTLSVAEAARDFGAILLCLENEQEEIVLTRDNRPIARVIPELESMDALAVFADLEGSLDDDAADSLLQSIEQGRQQQGATLTHLRHPWDS